MKIEAWVSLKLLDRDSHVISRRRFKSRSYVLAFINLLYALMGQTGISTPDTENTSRTVSQHQNNLAANAAAANALFGPVVGTGTTAVAITDYALGTNIAHGTSAGQLSYGVVSYIAPDTDGSTRRFKVVRSFTNSSGDTITVNECGIYVKGTVTPFYFCIVRDIIAGGVAVGNGQTLALTYEISVTV